MQYLLCLCSKINLTSCEWEHNEVNIEQTEIRLCYLTSLSDYGIIQQFLSVVAVRLDKLVLLVN